MAHLRYLDDAGHIRTAELAQGRFVIGRVASCNITFVDDLISREHAQIEPGQDGRYHIRDLGSRNKTYVNGELAAETALAAGDVVRIGDRVLEFLDDGAGLEKVDLEFLTPDRTDPPGCEWIKIKTPLTLSLAQLGRLSGLAGDFGVLVRPEDVVEAALSYLIVDFQAERGFVALRGDTKRDLRIVSQRGLARAPRGSLTPVSQTFVYSALLQQVAGRYPDSASQIQSKAGFAAAGMVAPLVYRNDTIGVMYVDRPATKRTFSASELQQFTAAGAQLGAMMATATRRLSQSAARQGRAFMSHVRRVQTQLTPTLPELDDFDVADQLVAGHGRCGDLCDMVRVGEGGACSLVVDSGGHGVLGLAQAAAIRTALRTALSVPEAATDLGEVFSALNQALIGLPGRQLVACCAVRLDLTAGRLSYVNAGTAMPLLLPAATRLQTLEHPSLILGTDAEYSYDTTTVDLPPDFRLVLYTDGLVDSCNAGGEPFGEERLKTVLLDPTAFGSPNEMVATVIRAFNEHLAGNPHDDDALIMVIGR